MKSPLKSSRLTSDGDELTSEECLEEFQNDSSEQSGSEEEWNGITQHEPPTTSGQGLANEVEITILQAARPSSMLHQTERIATFTDPFAGAYVPPHLRKAQDSNPQANQKLTKQLKGLLNRYVYSLKSFLWRVTYVSQDE
jgi:nucleolar MIF4G domain-containing protein 1